MLGDNPEKSKNPLKKAMRRRNAKTVQFTAPTYVEASEVEYSSEEEEENEGDYFGQGHNEEGPDGQGQDQEQVTDESATIEPLNSSGQPIINPQAAIDPRVDAPTQSDGVDRSRPSEEANEQPGMRTQPITFIALLTFTDDGAFAKSRKGTVRNTDSFFKDDNVETRKINLTPSLLRDDSSSTINTVRSVEPREVCSTIPIVITVY